MTVEAKDTVAQRIRARVAAAREELVAYSADLVAAPSVNPPGDTRQVAGVVAAYLEQSGLRPRLEAVDPSMPSVLAEIDSGRPGPHLVLNVHLDTMPPGDESLWSVPRFELTRRDGRLYGLGMGNMKGAVAAMSLAAALLAENTAAWCGRITFTAVADEVVFGDNGAAYLLRTHPALAGDGLICGEGPGFRRIAVGEKGVLWLELSAGAEGGHSSSVRRGASASARIAAAVLAVDALTGRTAALPGELHAVEAPEGDPGLSLTANVGTVQAGTFIGQVATTATAEVDLRLPPGLSADDAEQAVRDAVAGIEGVSCRRIKGWDANWTAPADPLVAAFAAAAVDVRGVQPPFAVRLPASDASRWRRLGVPAFCYGPQPTLSAGIDDYAEEDEVVDCAAMYALAALRFLSMTTRDG
jgi:succinyl-diaminopimelate desuccinylase